MPGAPAPDKRLRRLNADDAAALARHHGDCFITPWSQDAFARHLVSAAVTGLGVYDDRKQMIAHVLIQTAADEADILTIGVSPARRMAGLGRAILAEGLREAFLRGARRVSLEVAQGNLAAQALYAAAGFEIVGRRPGYYSRPDAPAEMALTLRLTMDRPGPAMGGPMGED